MTLLHFTSDTTELAWLTLRLICRWLHLDHFFENRENCMTSLQSSNRQCKHFYTRPLNHGLTLAGRHPDDGHAGERPPGGAPDVSGAGQELAGCREPLTSC